MCTPQPLGTHTEKLVLAGAREHALDEVAEFDFPKDFRDLFHAPAMGRVGLAGSPSEH